MTEKLLAALPGDQAESDEENNATTGPISDQAHCSYGMAMYQRRARER